MGYAALARMKVGSNQHKPVVGDAEIDRKEAPSIEGTTITTAQAAEKAGVTVATMERAMSVDRNGSPELIEAVKNGEVAVSAAAKVVKELPDHAQQAAVVKASKETPRKIVEIAKVEAQKPKMRGEYSTLESASAHARQERAKWLHPYLACARHPRTRGRKWYITLFGVIMKAPAPAR